MERVKVSIIMGIYNCEKMLPVCISSILEQTFTDWELIMCDDGSSDATYQVAKKYADKYNNIVLLKNEQNLKLSATLNHCLTYAKGEYIARMDADDICLPERLSTQVEILENSDYDMVGSWALLYDENGIKGIRKTEEIPGKTSLKFGAPFIHPTIMAKRHVYDRLGGYTDTQDTVRVEDLDLWFRFYKAGFKAYNIPKPLIKYHESLSDYKKRSLTFAINIIKISYSGFKTLKFPIRYYVYLLKPIISALIPNKIMYQYHKGKA